MLDKCPWIKNCNDVAMRRQKLKYPIPCKFRYLPPLTGIAPSYPFCRLPDIVNRARSILRDKTQDDIRDIWRTTCGVIRKQAKRQKLTEVDPVLLLNQRIDQQSRTLNHPYAKYPLCDYFAVLALSLIDDAMHTLDQTKKTFLPAKQKSEWLTNEDRNTIAANKAIFAMDAISIAEKLYDDDKKFSILGKKGASIRHAANHELRDWTIQRYLEKSWPSANKAAHALKAQVIQHGREIGAYLTEENAQRTIADWIRKYA